MPKELSITNVFDDPNYVMTYSKSLLRNSDKMVLFTESRNDTSIYQEMLNGEKITFISLRGKPLCMECTRLCHESQIKQTGAFVDADYDRFKEGISYTCIFTDKFDLEGFSIFSEKWNRIIREIISLEKAKKKFGIASYKEFLTKVIDVCFPVGILMYLNDVNDEYRIDFKEYKFDRKCKIPPSLENTVSLVLGRLKNLNPQKVTSKVETDLKKDAELLIKNIELKDRHLYISSTLISNAIVELSKTHNLFKSVRRGDKKEEVVLNGITLKGYFRSHIDESIFYDSQMYSALNEILDKYGLK